VKVSTQKGVSVVLGHSVLLALSVIFAAPFAWQLSTSLKHETSIFPEVGKPPEWIPRLIERDAEGRRLVDYEGTPAAFLGLGEDGRPRVLLDGQEIVVSSEDELSTRKTIGFHWQNYVDAFHTINFPRALKNTLFVCFMCVIGVVIASSFVAYGFARIPWKGRDAVFVLVLCTMMIPYQVTLIPLFVVFKNIGWSGTFKPLIVPFFFGTPFFIFLLRQFFKGIPEDLSAAARIDGCNELGIFLRIILPLSKPALATTALFTFLNTWSDFLNPLVYLQDERQFTLAVALQQFQNQHESLWGPLMAMSTVITVPVIVLFFLTQRTFIQGITLTGLKG
jgi:multiple sugar transport system permease protein